MGSTDAKDVESGNALVTSTDPQHPANLICSLCRTFYTLGWVTGTGGGTSIRHGAHIFIAPSGVQKELMQPTDMFVLDYASREYLRRPPVLKPSACTPLFLAAFDHGAGCCIHTHSQWAVLVTLLVERDAAAKGLKVDSVLFEIELLEQIKGIPKGKSKEGMMGYLDRLKIPIIANTPQYVLLALHPQWLTISSEEDLTHSLEKAMKDYPDTYAVLVQRHGM